MDAELVLPLHGLHVADTHTVPGSVYLGGLKVPATILVDGGSVCLRVWLSGLAGRYPMSVAFGHVKRVPLGLVLEVDGVGSMKLVPEPAPVAAPAATTVDTSRGGLLARARQALPEPVAQGLRKVPLLRKWYAGRAG